MRMLVQRIRSHLDAKIAMFLVLAAGIVIPYFSLQRWQPFPPRAPFVTALDGFIPFEPAWAPAYLSVCLLVPLFPLLARERQDVWRFLHGIAALCVPCFATFLLAPMPGPRPDLAAAEGVYGWLVGVDATWNAFPSLHAGLVLYSFAFGWRLLGRELRPLGRAIFLGLSLVWGASILYGTLATKQHWVADLPPAFALALVAHHLAWRARSVVSLDALKGVSARRPD